jgi:hypothetical protein
MGGDRGARAVVVRLLNTGWAERARLGDDILIVARRDDNATP